MADYEGYASSDYGDDERLAEVVNDELPIKSPTPITNATLDDITSTSSAAPDTLTGTTAVTMEADERLIIVAEVSLSHQTDGQRVSIGVFIDGSIVGPWHRMTMADASGGGLKQTITLVRYHEPSSSGSPTITVRGYVDSGTGNSGYRYVTFRIEKRRS